jgi:hypothetical protein
LKTLSDQLDGDLLEEMRSTCTPENLYVVQLSHTPDGILCVTPFNLQEFKQSMIDKGERKGKTWWWNGMQNRMEKQDRETGWRNRMEKQDGETGRWNRKAKGKVKQETNKRTNKHKQTNE